MRASSANAAVEWVGRSKMDEASGRKLYRAFLLDGCKYEVGDCVYLNAPKDEKDEGTALFSHHPCVSSPLRVRHHRGGRDLYSIVVRVCVARDQTV